MSKAAAATLLLIESARRSFNNPGVRTITSHAWSETCSDPSIHRYVANNLDSSGGLLKKLTNKSQSASDFQNLHDELLPRVSFLSQLDPLQAVFHGYVAEDLLYGEVCGIFSEAIEEIAIEKLTEELESLI
jgi:hypothetical protein